MTKLTSAMPKEHGLSDPKLIKEPTEVHAVIALVDCKKITTDVDSGDIEPTVRIRRVEIITDADLLDARQMFLAAIEKRTGATMLDGFEDAIDQDIKAAFGQVSLNTGET